ncbi:thymidine kinase [TM7 phylum sp. oral taxon 351]|nr:thymidine kinase [TM7 phylum sp. oral taxon 351]
MSKLYFRYGAMGCGKTMQLLQVAFNYEERGHKVCVMKPKTDTKNGEKLLTRIGPEREVNFCFDKEANLFEKVKKEFAKGAKKVACVLIDEAQFLTKEQVDQLMEIVTELDIPVMAYGLRLNFRLTDGGFEGATRLLQIAQDIDEIKTICECGRKATYNARFLGNKFVADGPDVLIDDGKTEIEYRAICPKCYADYRAGRK